MRAMNHLTTKDFTIIMERDDQRAAELAEHSVEVRLLILGMILFCKHQVHARLITEWLAPMCRHIGELRLFAVPLKDTCYRRLHVCGRSKFLRSCRGQRVARLQQYHVETRIETIRKHRVGLIRFASLASHATVLQLQFSGGATAMSAEHRASPAGGPVLEFAVFLED